jgi:hypothetical protein
MRGFPPRDQVAGEVEWGAVNHSHGRTAFRTRSPAPPSVGHPAWTQALSSSGQYRRDLPIFIDGIARQFDSIQSRRLPMHSMAQAALASMRRGDAAGTFGSSATRHPLALDPRAQFAHYGI